jgi:hypothetical protein
MAPSLTQTLSVENQTTADAASVVPLQLPPAVRQSCGEEEGTRLVVEREAIPEAAEQRQWDEQVHALEGLGLAEEASACGLQTRTKSA